MKACIGIILIFCFTGPFCNGQGIDSLADNVANFPSKFFSKIREKYSTLESSLSKKTNKYLARLQKQEKKLRKQLRRQDSTGNYVRENTDSAYTAFRQQLAQQQQRLKEGKVNLTEYNGYIDSLSTSLDFLKSAKELQDKIKLPTETLNALKNKFNETEKIKEFIAQRKERLKNMLSGYTKLPASLQKEYAKLNKTIYYYHAQVQEYRDMLKDPEKIERKALSLLNKVPAFQKFMKENSQLASLFGLPENYGTPASLAGLQTRANVQQIIQQRITAGGPNAAAMIRQNLQEAQSKLSELKDKLLKASSLGEQVPSPGGDLGEAFKPNTQKTKPFLKRLEYGLNMQFDKSNSLLPTTSNLALTLGYKLNDKGAIGVGMSYKLGLGTIQHIRFSSQGIGFRSYVDWKVSKGSSKIPLFSNMAISGGYELNYNNGFKNINELKNYSLWQRSALLGFSKKAGNISAPFGGKKKGAATIQLLYDFLARDHVPVSSPLVVRFGYKF